MAKTGQFIHRTKLTHSVTFDTTYGEAKTIPVRLNQISDGANSSVVRKNAVYSGNISLIRIKGTISGGASQLTLKAYTDTAGDNLLLPPSVSSFEPSIDGTTVSCVLRVDAYHADVSDALSIFCKVNVGSFSATEILITWFE